MIKEKILFGIHSVHEALQAEKEIDKIYLRRALVNDEVRAIKQLARAQRVPIFEVPAEKLNRFTRGAHQGCVAIMAQVSYTDIEQLIPMLFEQGEDPFVVVLDGVTDTRNFGAIARSAECAGAHALIIAERGSVSVSADAVNASAGALMRIPVCRVSSITQAAVYLRECGLQLIAASEKSALPYYQTPLVGPIALVMGGEHEGISPAVLRQAERSVVIPQKGKIGSLNVSVAAGIILFEIARQRTLE